MVVEFFGSITYNSLTDEPIIVVACAAKVREFSRHRIDCGETCEILTATERLYVEAFIGAPHQFTVEVGALQVGCNLRLPLFSGDGREHVEQFFFFFCHFKRIYWY